jgi:hypothetical protein
MSISFSVSFLVNQRAAGDPVPEKAEEETREGR